MAPTVPIEFSGQKASRKSSISQVMGKSRKVSKGHLTGFVADFRHAVHTLDESKGFGSVEEVDTEMTASENSCALKRKCISLNSDGYNFGVPLQVLLVSKMSRSDKKDVELRLKMELEQVQMFQKKISSLPLNVVSSPSNDIWSCSDGLRKPPLESFNRSSEVLVPQVKKQAPAGRNGSRMKGGMPKHFDIVKQAAPPSNLNSMLLKQCKTLLNSLMAHQYGWVFNTPVDAVKLNIPDYFTVIKHPMDLGTVKSKLLSDQYLSPLSFSADVRLTFANAISYNPPGNDVHFMANTLNKYFEAKWKVIEKKLPETLNPQPMPSRSDAHVKTGMGIQAPPSKKKKMTPTVSARQIMTDKEKHKLSTELEASLGELPERIVDFLKEQSFATGQTNEDEIEIDIDALNDDTLFKLRMLLDDYLLEKLKKLEKAEPCEIETCNESGVSNSSMPPCKGNETVDEDVDIVGGNDPPISGFRPVEIEKEAVNRNSKCGSLSCSSGESGSSSSDSDLGSSSGSDLKAVKVSTPKRSDFGDSDIGVESGAGQVKQTQSKPASVEAGDHQEGESAPSERQVSPEKLYRAALLRNRFADTILKAQQKSLEKVEKRDPETVRLEREELERGHREEKARLQAEARAAEEARKKAEAEVAAEAAAEARRKRELEREAARQKLQEMEKTVDINEDTHFMVDLEMLRAADEEQLPSFIEETSPFHSENRLGSFKLQGSNPLEQLGLYMKLDDEDEEEEFAPPRSVIIPVNDVEDGEID